MYFAMYEEGGPGGTLSCLDDPEDENATIAGATIDEVKARIGVLAGQGRLNHTGPIVICQTVERLDLDWEPDMESLCEVCDEQLGAHAFTGDYCPNPSGIPHHWLDTSFKLKKVA